MHFVKYPFYSFSPDNDTADDINSSSDDTDDDDDVNDDDAVSFGVTESTETSVVHVGVEASSASAGQSVDVVIIPSCRNENIGQPCFFSQSIHNPESDVGK